MLLESCHLQWGLLHLGACALIVSRSFILCVSSRSIAWQDTAGLRDVFEICFLEWFIMFLYQVMVINGLSKQIAGSEHCNYCIAIVGIEWFDLEGTLRVV